MKKCEKRLFELTMWVGEWNFNLRVPLGWVLLVALAFGLIIFAGPIVTHLSGVGDAHGSYSEDEPRMLAPQDNMVHHRRLSVPDNVFVQ